MMVNLRTARTEANSHKMILTMKVIIALEVCRRSIAEKLENAPPQAEKNIRRNFSHKLTLRQKEDFFNATI